MTYSGDFTGLLAEIMGREAGICGGIGGSQHLSYRRFHSNGVQGGMTAIGVGHGLAARMRSGNGIVAVIAGDGTLGEGLLYESLNLASIWELPLLFVIESNGIAQTTPTSWTTGGNIQVRGDAFGLNTWRFDDAEPDFLQNVADAVGQVRLSRRPGFLVIDTRRMGPHSKGDDLRGAREVEAIRRRDPLRQLGEKLPGEEREEIDVAARAYVDFARAAATASPSAKRLLAHRSIFTSPLAPEGDPQPLPRPAINVRGSLNLALNRLLTDHPEVILLGEDLHDPYGGAFKVTAGLSTAFPDRVISTPISEAGIVGTAIGLAMDGYLPIVELMFADFLTLAMDQLFNHAVKFPGMFPHTPSSTCDSDCQRGR